MVHEPPFPVEATGHVTRVFGFVDWRRYAASGGLHTGVDLDARRGAAVFAVADGKVAKADEHGVVVLTHGKWWSVYRHVIPPFPETGQEVKGGSVIAHVGRRGYLHFEVRAPRRAAFAPGLRAIWVDGVWAVDPLRWIALLAPAPKFCGGVTGFPGVEVHTRPNVQSEQVGFLPQGTAVEGQEMFWDVNGQIWLRLRGTPERWIPVRLGLTMAEVRPCDG